MKVYQAINAIQKELAKVGISKSRRNTQGSGYNFRGIDDVYNVLSPLLGEHGLCILPRVLSRNVVERESRSGGNLFYVTVDVEFDFVCADDGSRHTVRTVGEAMDSGDKATNKAMSAAYKYAAFQAFAIPTEGDNDADASTHEVKAAAKTDNVKPIDAKAQEDMARLNAHNAAVARNMESVQAIKQYIAAEDIGEAAKCWYELSEEDQGALWRAPTKGGVFTTDEREVMKNQFSQYKGIA